jgi:hypothetical protein
MHLCDHNALMSLTIEPHSQTRGTIPPDFSQQSDPWAFADLLVIPKVGLEHAHGYWASGGLVPD